MGFPNKIIQDIAVAVLQRNAYFAHHENTLLAMLADNDHNFRLLAVNKILSIRVSKKNLDNVGGDEEVDVTKFIISKINTNAKTYYSLSSLSLKDIYESPALKHLLNEEIEAFQRVDDMLSFSLRPYVENAVYMKRFEVTVFLSGGCQTSSYKCHYKLSF